MSAAANGTGAARFDPRLLVFACNWCSYAGADTAGVSRLAQTPHFRLLRVMCSGRVHPAHVLRALARGADGVMVSGCHFGDCHYIFGNHRAVEQFEKTRALTRILGLEEDRLRLEWISAAEGIRFAETMNDFVARVRAVGPSPIAPGDDPAAVAEDRTPLEFGASGALGCLECGRCTAVCPLARHQRFSPRRLLSCAAALGLDRAARDATLWTCLTCGQCQAVCPAGVDYPRFILAARARAVADGRGPFTASIASGSATIAAAPGTVPCSHGGVFEQIATLAARPGLRQSRLAWVPPDATIDAVPEGGRAEADELFFVGCSPYFAAYFGGTTGDALTASLRASVRLLNRAGVVPALLANERCCGNPLRLTGRAVEAARLEARVAEQIRASGARRVITACPECLVALRGIAARHGGGFEVVHLSTRLAGHPALRRTEGAPAGAGERVTFQDPCRLGRYSGLYDPPRELLREVGGVDLVEMDHTRETAVCCGNTAWIHCNAATQSFQRARLAEAAATGGTLVTACPGCLIHLSCAQQALSGTAEGAVRIADLWTLLAGPEPEGTVAESAHLGTLEDVTGEPQPTA
jgi:Fe-S oxidoreductase/coenzyme F420-reducing hydrogenase delta subunit